MEWENLNRPRYKKQVYAFKVLSASFTIFIILCLQATPTHAQTPPNTTQVEDVDFENNKVYVGLWLNNIYSYQYKEGSYTIDFYLYFFWIDPNIETIDWYLLNGYPINPSTVTLVSNDTSSEIKNQIYRITAACSTTPDAKDFPLDTIQLGIAVEMLTHGYNLEFVWLENETGIDPNFKNAGWETSNVELTILSHDYPLGAELPRAEMTITQQRQRPLVDIQGLIPPIIFAIVSVFSFLFSLRDSTSVGLRLGLNTSMLVTTLLFNFTIASGIPPSSTISLYGLFMISVLFFIVMNLIVTITGYVQWFYYKNEKQTKITNRWGFVLSLIIPIVFFLLMLFLRN